MVPPPPPRDDEQQQPPAPQLVRRTRTNNLPPLIVGLSPKGKPDERAPALLDHLNLEPHEKVNHKTFQNGTSRLGSPPHPLTPSSFTHPPTVPTHPTGQIIPEKSEAQRKLIELALHQNSLFTCLDEEQITKFVREARLLEFNAGEVVFVQGEKGYDCFIVDDGQVEILDTHDDGTHECVLRKGRGAIFGDGSMIFHRRRSATVKAKGKVRAWVVDDEVFVEKILYSTRIKTLFDKYASLKDPQGEGVMTMDDFVRSCNDTSVIDVIKYSQLRSLYRIIRGGQVSEA